MQSTASVRIAALMLAAGASAALAQAPTPIVPVGADIVEGQAQGPGAYPNVLSASTWTLRLPANTILGGFGSNAVRVERLVSGPIRWTAGNINEGDIDGVLGPAEPNDPRSYPTWPGYDAFRETGGSAVPAAPLPGAVASPTALSDNWGRLRLSGSRQFARTNYAWGIHPAHGVLINTTAANGRDNLDSRKNGGSNSLPGQPVGTFYAVAHVTDDGGDSTGRGYNPITGEFRGTGLYFSVEHLGLRGDDQDEAVIDMAAAYFPYEQGWIGGYYSPSANDWRTRDLGGAFGVVQCAAPSIRGSAATVVAELSASDALFRVTIPGGSPEQGLLLAGCGADNNVANITGVLPEQGSWQVAQRFDFDAIPAGDLLATNDENARFYFVYVPFSAANLVAGQIGPDGASVRGTANYTLVRTGPGTYRLTIPGKTDLTGAVLLGVAGSAPAVDGAPALLPDNTVLSHQFDSRSSSWEIQSRVLDVGDNVWAGSGQAYPLRDGGFYFMYIDFTNPPALGGGGPAGCNVADIVSIGGFPPADGELTVDDYTSFINAFAGDELLADIVSIGGFPPADGELTVDDYTSFINAFAEGCD